MVDQVVIVRVEYWLTSGTGRRLLESASEDGSTMDSSGTEPTELMLSLVSVVRIANDQQIVSLVAIEDAAPVYRQVCVQV